MDTPNNFQNTTNSANGMNNPSQPKSSKKLWVILGIVILVLLIGAGVLWFFMQKDSSDTKNNTANTTTNNTTNTAVTTNTSSNTTTSNSTSNTTQNSSDVSSVKLNGVTVYYPTTFGTPTATTTTENMNSDQPYQSVFAGGNITFKNVENGTIWVNNVDSYLSAKQDFLSGNKDVVDALKTVYDEQGISNAKVNGLNITGRSLTDTTSTQWVLPLTNSTQIPYSAHYLYSTSGPWRGYWFLGDETQDPGAFNGPVFMAAMYNKTKGIIYSIKIPLVSADATVLINKNNANVTTDYTSEIDSYMKSAYASDAQIKTQVDKIISAVIMTDKPAQ